MQSIFSNVTKAQIRRDPFPHVVFRDALPEDLADQLLAEYPSMQYLGEGRQGLTKGGKMPNNIKLRYQSIDVLRDTKLAPIWKEFIQRHISPEFFSEFLHLFQDELLSMYPHLKSFFSSMKGEDVGVMHVDRYTEKKVLLNAEICADSAVTKLSTVRTIHLDHPQKLAVALLYLRSKDNTSVGGSLDIYKKVNEEKFVLNHVRNVKDAYQKNFEKVASLPYEHNTLLLFLNCPTAFHGVSPRMPTQFPRNVFDIAFEIEEPLFDLSLYAENKWITRIRARLMKLLGLHKEMWK